MPLTDPVGLRCAAGCLIGLAEVTSEASVSRRVEWRSPAEQTLASSEWAPAVPPAA